MGHCDGCGKDRRDVVSVGRDANGDPDAPDLCFPCRREGERGRVWCEERQGYVSATMLLTDTGEKPDEDHAAWLAAMGDDGDAPF